MTGGARDQILARIRAANRRRGPPQRRRRRGVRGADPGVPARPPRRRRTHDITALFAERAADYRAVVERVPEAGLAAAIARVLAARSAAAPGPFVVPDGLPAEWLAELPSGITLARDEPPLAAAELDRMSGVVTGCAVAIAETGHDHPGPRPRPGPPRAYPGARLPPGRRAPGPDRRRPGRRVRPARPGPAAHADLRPVRHQRHRTDPGGGRARPPQPARAAHRIRFHDPEGSSTPRGTRSFMIMKFSRGRERSP